MRKPLPILVVVGLFAAACGSDAASPSTTPASASPSSTVPATAPGADLHVRYGELTERTLGIEADGTNTNAAIDGMNAFTIDLYRQVASTQPDDGDVDSPNVVISPYSVTFALSMILAGARGETADEMAEVLHADNPDADWQQGINAYDLSLDARTAGSPTTWAAANKVWTRPGLALRTEYLDTLTGVYGSPLAEADFAADAEAQRQVINGWIAQQTNDLIPELWPSGALAPNTAMVLVNAIALDAPWEFPFDPASTTDRPFTLPDGSTVKVPMMRYDEFLPTGFGDDYAAVELPYGGGALSMVVIVPPDLAEFEADLSVESLEAVTDSIQDGGIHLTLPKWSARTHLTLNDTLSAMGMSTAFGGGADFTGMTDGGGLVLNRVEHEAFVEVDEQGTRAAAATGGAMADSHGPSIDVNQPFLYVIRDRGAGTILFIGRVTDPSIPA